MTLLYCFMVQFWCSGTNCWHFLRETEVSMGTLTGLRLQNQYKTRCDANSDTFLSEPAWTFSAIWATVARLLDWTTRGQLLLPMCIDESWVHFTCQWTESYVRSVDLLIEGLRCPCVVFWWFLWDYRLDSPSNSSVYIWSIWSIKLAADQVNCWFCPKTQNDEMFSLHCLKPQACYTQAGFTYCKTSENLQINTNVSLHTEAPCVIHWINAFPNTVGLSINLLQVCLVPSVVCLSLCSFWGVDLSRHVTEHLLAGMWLHLTVDPLWSGFKPA